MKRSDAERRVANVCANLNTVDSASHIQSAESLNEIAQFTVRDRFALAAMQSLFSDHGTGNITVSKLEYAYQIADMMLEARHK